MIVRLPLLAALAALASLVFFSARASADDCPAGSRPKTEDGFSWCEPSVCLDDGNCDPSEVCRPVPLCVQVGALAPPSSTLRAVGPPSAGPQARASDAAQRLVVTQRCAPDKSCPPTTTCSDMKRCVSRAAAPPAPSAAPDTAGGGAKKSSCGCATIGAKADGLAALFAGLALAAAAGARARRRR